MEHILYLKIENDIRPARVIPVSHPHHRLYHVIFEDGYENMFYTDVETGNWIEEDLGETDLALMIGAKIKKLDKLRNTSRKSLVWCRASVASIVINFGFCTYSDEGTTIFEIYRDNRKFLCNLVKNKKGKWTIYAAQRPVMEYQYTNQVQIIISIFEGMADQC